jgi:hypothetical protein
LDAATAGLIEIHSAIAAITIADRSRLVVGTPNDAFRDAVGLLVEEHEADDLHRGRLGVDAARSGRLEDKLRSPARRRRAPGRQGSANRP